MDDVRPPTRCRRCAPGIDLPRKGGGEEGCRSTRHAPLESNALFTSPLAGEVVNSAGVGGWGDMTLSGTNLNTHFPSITSFATSPMYARRPFLSDRSASVLNCTAIATLWSAKYSTSDR